MPLRHTRILPFHEAFVVRDGTLSNHICKLELRRTKVDTGMVPSIRFVGRECWLRAVRVLTTNLRSPFRQGRCLCNPAVATAQPRGKILMSEADQQRLGAARPRVRGRAPGCIPARQTVNKR